MPGPNLGSTRGVGRRPRRRRCTGGLQGGEYGDARVGPAVPHASMAPHGTSLLRQLLTSPEYTALWHSARDACDDGSGQLGLPPFPPGSTKGTATDTAHTGGPSRPTTAGSSLSVTRRRAAADTSRYPWRHQHDRRTSQAKGANVILVGVVNRAAPSRVWPAPWLRV